MSAKPTALFITYDGMTDPLGQSQVLSYLKPISKAGYSIDIVSYEKPGVYESKKEQVEKMIAGYDIHWHPISYTKSPPILSSIYDFERGKALVRKLVPQRKYSIIHSRSSMIGSIALLAKKLSGGKLIFDMRGWWADEKKDSGNWASAIFKPVYSYFKNLETQLFVKSAVTISLTNVGKEEIVKLGHKTADKIAVIPTCVNFQYFTPFNADIRAEVRKELDIPLDAKVLLYSGSIGGNYNSAMLLDVLKVLRELNPNSYLLILTLSAKDYIIELLNERGLPLDAVRFAKADYSKVHRYLMAGDMGVVNYAQAYSTIGRSPTKLGEYWSCGLPVIAESGIGDMDYLLNRYPKGGKLLYGLSNNEYARVLNELTNVPIDKDVLRQYAEEYYDLEQGAQQYISIYQSLAPPVQ
ncbi:glycosyltransferase family 4 protein [soil metagenome]